MNQDDVLRLALEAIEHLSHNARKAGVEMGLAFVVAEEATEAIRKKLAEQPAQQEPVAITEQMAFAFHNAITDGALGKDDTMDIMRGLKAAFAHIAAPQPAQQQEPVAWWNPTKDSVSTDPVHRHNKDCQPLYTSPPAQRTWVGLTDKEVEDVYRIVRPDVMKFWRECEAKLKEKNT